MAERPIDRMKNPEYIFLIQKLETEIFRSDEYAKTKGIALTDSQIKSALNKTKKLLTHGETAIPETNEREKIISGLITNLLRVTNLPIGANKDGNKHANAGITDAGEWLKAIETIQESMKIRKSDAPASRDYLDFIRSFIKQIDENPEEEEMDDYEEDDEDFDEDGYDDDYDSEDEDDYENGEDDMD